MRALDSVSSQLNAGSTYRMSHMAEKEVRSATNGSHYTGAGELPLVPGIDGVGRAPDRTLRYFILPDTTLGAMAEQTVVDLVAGGDRALRADLRIVYTPMHGVGGTTVQRVLELAGFRAPA